MSSISEDKEQIRELLANYCFYADSGQAENHVELFADDCMLDLGPHGRYQGKAAILELQQRKGGKTTNIRHHTTNIVIALKGEEAQVKSYVLALNVGENPPVIVFSGHYFDDLEKVNGRWLFKYRRARTDPRNVE